MSERALLLGGILVLVAGENGSRRLSQALGVLNSFFFGPVFFLVLVYVLVGDDQRTCIFISHTHMMEGAIFICQSGARVIFENSALAIWLHCML